MDESFAEQIFDELDSIGPEMSKDEILTQVAKVQNMISDEFGWEDPGEEEED